MKKLLILGGGKAQIPLITMAKQLHYYTIVCDMRTDIDGVKFADKHIKLDYTDSEKVLSVAMENKVHGVISNSEPAMKSVAYATQSLNLPGNRVDSIENLLSKKKFRELQRRIGVFAPLHFSVSTFQGLLESVEKMKFPIIIKPVEASGTRGTTKLNEYDESILKQAFTRCQAYSRDRLVAVEEFVEMKNKNVLGAEIFVIGEEVIWDGFYHQNRPDELPLVPSAEILPPCISNEELELAKSVIGKIIQEAGIRHGELNVEFYFTQDDEVFVIEINPRQGGNNLPQLVKDYCGLDLTKLLLTTAVNDQSYYNELSHHTHNKNYIAQHVVFTCQNGTYDGIEIHSSIAPYVYRIEEEHLRGDVIEKSENAGGVVAYVCLKFKTREEQLSVVDTMERYVNIKYRN